MLSIKIPKIFPLMALTALTLLTAFRNLSPAYYLLLGAGIAFYMIPILKNEKFFKFNKEFLPLYIFIYYTLFVAVWSFFYLMSLEPLAALPRLLLMPMIAFVFLYFLKDKTDYILMLKVILFCFTLGSASIVFQFFFGEVPWFASSATRGSLVRYSSILGSLTVFGTIVGFQFLLIFSPSEIIKSFVLRSILFLILLLGVALSLQKTSVFILFISFFILMIFNLWINGPRIKLNHLLMGITTLSLLPVLIAIDPTFQNYVSTLLTASTGLDISSFSSSLVEVRNVSESTISTYEIWMRLIGFASVVYEYYGNFIWFIGIGVKGGAGVMGLEGISSHNGLADLLVMGGPIYLIIFLYIYFFIQKSLYKDLNSSLDATFFVSNLIFLIIAIPTAGAVFQPSVSILFWLSAAYVLKKKLSYSEGKC